MFDDNYQTTTSEQQSALEQKIADLYKELFLSEDIHWEELLLLDRSVHVPYLQRGLGKLDGAFASLDASRPWIVYWIVHSLRLLGAPLPEKVTSTMIVEFLRSCQHQQGGYGGGPMQLPHLAPTYAAVCALVDLGTDEALASVDRQAMLSFLRRMMVPLSEGGGFRVHEGGECDVRACYTALAVAQMLCLDVGALVEESGVVEYLKKCQTYEGGLGGEPGNEAHGGYTFCGVAGLLLAGHAEELDLPCLLRWLTQRQGWVEGGFNGRTNKLVDGCYSFWQGGVFPLLLSLNRNQLSHVKAGAGRRCRNEEVNSSLVASVSEETSAENVAQQEGRDANTPGAYPLPLPSHAPALPDCLWEVRGPVQEAQALVEELLNDEEEGEPVPHYQKVLDQAMTRLAVAKHSAAVICGSTAPAPGGIECTPGVKKGGLQGGAIEAKVEEKGPASEGQPGSKESNIQGGDSCKPSGMPEATQDPNSGGVSSTLSSSWSDMEALQLWILKCCQYTRGGLRDKPGKPVDYYHTCYCLSGLSAAQRLPQSRVVGPERNLLEECDPACNVLKSKLEAAREYYSRRENLEVGGTLRT